MKNKRCRFTPRSLEAAIDRYYASIRRTVVATERVETGAKTFEEKPILSDTGEPIRCREYVVAPTVWGLCEALGITPAQWKSFCDREEHPEFQDAVQRAAGLMEEWKEQALLTKKDVRGLILLGGRHRPGGPGGFRGPAAAALLAVRRSPGAGHDGMPRMRQREDGGGAGRTVHRLHHRKRHQDPRPPRFSGRDGPAGERPTVLPYGELKTLLRNTIVGGMGDREQLRRMIGQWAAQGRIEDYEVDILWKEFGLDSPEETARGGASGGRALQYTK